VRFVYFRSSSLYPRGFTRIWFPRLRTCCVLLLLLVPKPALVRWPSTQIPRLDQETLRGINIALIPYFFHPDLHAIFSENNVLVFEFVGRSGGNILESEIEIVGDECCNADDYEKEEERENFA